MAEVINMQQDNHSPSPPLVEHGLRPKGHAIKGIDYGLDLLNDADKKTEPVASSSAPAPVSPQQHSQPQPSQHYPQQQYMQQQYTQPQQNNGFGFGFGSGSEPQQSKYSMPGFASPQDAQSYGEGSSQGHGQDQGFGQDHSQYAGMGFVDHNLMGNMPNVEELSYEEKRNRKTDALASLARLEAQGYVPAGKKGSHTTELAELESMVEKLTAQRDLDNSIKFQRKLLVGFATLAESVCETEEYNIFELDLEGWSESLYENISEYDDVFEELYLKYKDVAHIPPEIKLVSMVAGSAWMYHMSRNMFGKVASKVPGFDEVMKFDPELKKLYQQRATDLARNRGVPVPDHKKDKSGGMGFLGKMFGVGGTPNMEPPPPPPTHRKGGNSHRQQHQQHQPRHQQQRNQPQQHQQHQPQQTQHHQPQEPPRRRRNRVPMAEPVDVDGLLDGLIDNNNNYNNDYVPEEDELDLSEMENISDLDN